MENKAVEELRRIMSVINAFIDNQQEADQTALKSFWNSISDGVNRIEEQDQLDANESKKIMKLLDDTSPNIISEEEWLKNGKLANRFK
jgi:hypothetical protein